MKLPERFRDDRGATVFDPEVEAELAAIDAALAGGPVPPESEGMAQLVRELRAERAEPDPDFAAQLDRWAADGFPRAERPGAAPGHLERATAGLERLSARLRSVQPRRLVMPAGAAATLIVVAGVAISQNAGSMDEAASGGGDGVSAVPEQSPGDGSGEALENSSGGADEPTPSAARAPQRLDELSSGRDVRGLTEARAALRNSAPAASAIRNRRVARDADLVLASDPEEIPGVSDGVNEVVNRYRGFVTSSSVQSGDANRGGLGAQFRMKFPAKNLQLALADLSELAHVRSRTEGTEDITGRFISAQERIEENEAARAGLIERLANAETDLEAAAIRAQLRIVNSQLSAARADLAGARERVRLVPVSVSIVPEEGASARDDRDGGWGVADAIKDAGEVLSTTAGIAIIAGAVLLPLALVGIVVALAMRAWAGRGRERALDGE